MTALTDACRGISPSTRRRLFIARLALRRHLFGARRARSSNSKHGCRLSDQMRTFCSCLILSAIFQAMLNLALSVVHGQLFCSSGCSPRPTENIGCEDCLAMPGMSEGSHRHLETMAGVVGGGTTPYDKARICCRLSASPVVQPRLRARHVDSVCSRRGKTNFAAHSRFQPLSETAMVASA